MRTLCVLVLLLSSTAACTVDKVSTQPTPVPTLTGTWSGDLALQGTTARMTWTLTQTDAVVAGPVLVLLPSGTVLLNGALSGTLSGTTLTYVIDIGPGAVPSQPACTGQLGGSASATFTTPSTLAGTYTLVSSSCPTPFSTGPFTLTRM